jgi:hypothetical protein
MWTRYQKAFLAWTFLFLFPLGASASEDGIAVWETVLKEMDTHRSIQKSEDKWAAEKDELLSQYRALEEKRQGLQEKKEILRARLDVLSRSVSEAERKTIETQKVMAQLQATLQEILSRLRAFIDTDLPFLSEERSERVEALKILLARPDVDLSEKCRRVMEALHVETEYGHGFEVSQETIDIDSRPVAVEILRAGRLSLFFRTPDGEVVGFYDPAASEWKRLPSRYKRPMMEATEMALRRRPVDLVKLPLGRIQVP